MADDTAMPRPTPAKCTAWRSLRLIMARWLKTMLVVKIMTKALARPARNRNATKARTLPLAPIAAASSAFAARPASATIRSRPVAQPPAAATAPKR